MPSGPGARGPHSAEHCRLHAVLPKVSSARQSTAPHVAAHQFEGTAPVYKASRVARAARVHVIPRNPYGRSTTCKDKRESYPIPLALGSHSNDASATQAQHPAWHCSSASEQYCSACAAASELETRRECHGIPCNCQPPHCMAHAIRPRRQRKAKLSP